MAFAERVCPHCRWRNETTARICGGCGTPLPVIQTEASGANAPVGSAGAVGSAWPASGPGTAGAYAPNAPTVYAPPSAPGYSALAGMPPGAPVPAAGAPPVAWPCASAGHARAPIAVAPKRRSWWKRALVALFVAVVVLTCGLLGAWSVIIRPAIHNSVDAQLRAVLSDDMRQVPAIPAGIPQIPYSIPAASVNTEIAQRLPDNTGLQRLTVHFIDGNVVFTYDSNGNHGTVTTQLVARNGHLIAQNTNVTGVLSLVENNQEMESAINASLSQLPQQDAFTKVDTAFDVLIVTVGGQ